MDMLFLWLPLAFGFGVGLLGLFVWVLNENMQYTLDQTSRLDR